MPHPLLPRQTASPSPISNEVTAEASKDVLHASFPFRPQVALLSASQRQFPSTTSMTIARQEHLSAGDYSRVLKQMNLQDPQSTIKTTPDHISLDCLGPNSTIFALPASFYRYGRRRSLHQDDLSYLYNYDLEYMAQYLVPDVLRPQDYPHFATFPYDASMPESYPPAVYQLEQPKQSEITDFSDQKINSQLSHHNAEYDSSIHGVSSFKMDGSHEYQSLYSDLTQASTPSDEVIDHSSSTYPEEDCTADKELPYAQLIYQALMAAPDKTLVLRDIYDWFRRHTDKASGSAPKGWMNSIRHNLSMNGAFEKVDQSCDEARRVFVWRLTEDAVRNGVKSTTRYRSRQSIKRNHRVQQRQSQRSIFGSKGRHATRRAVRMKRSNRISDIRRTNSGITRSMPVVFDSTLNNSNALVPYELDSYGWSKFDQSPVANVEGYHSPFTGDHFELFPSIQVHSAASTSRDMLINDTHFMLDQRLTQRLFTSSPSPSGDEPRTPESLGCWSENISPSAPYVFDELQYRAYAG